MERHRPAGGLADILSELRAGNSPSIELKHRRRQTGETSRVHFSPVTDEDGVLTHLIGVQDAAAVIEPGPA